MLMALFTTPVLAIGFDGNAAMYLVTSFTEPFITFLLWCIPIVCIIVAIKEFLVWSAKSEREKEQEPYIRSVAKLIFAGLIAFSITAIIRIFGIS